MSTPIHYRSCRIGRLCCSQKVLSTQTRLSHYRIRFHL
jgi:hypothetical protein